MSNAKAYAMIEKRLSDQVKLFNHLPVSVDDSDDHYWIVKARLELAKAALSRAPEIKVTTLARSLGDVYTAVRRNLKPAELKRYEELAEKLEALNDKYGG